jgi:bla regulator protein BlaR1
MTLLSSVLGGTTFIGWVLLHFLWQGALVGLVYKAAKVMFPRGEPRYRLGVVALLALALCPVLTSWHLSHAAANIPAIGPDTVAKAIQGGQALSFAAPASVPVLEAILPWMVLAWSCGVLFLCLRAWHQWRNVKALVKFAAVLPVWEFKANEMAKRFGVRQSLRVLCSARIATPILIGWIRPVILLPMAVICNFPATQIELIFAHELAHLRRWDPLINLFQVVLETLHFYHPVVHWIGRDVRNEREICCDAIALAIGGGSRREFAETLVELGDLSERETPLFLAASGGELMDRVEQIILPPDNIGHVTLSTRFIACVFSAVLVAITLCFQWSKTHAHGRLAESVQNVGATLALPILPVMQSIKATNWMDLTPARVQVLRAAKGTANIDGKTTLMSAVDDEKSMTLRILLPTVPRFADLITKIEQPISPPFDSDYAANSAPTPVAIRIQQPVYPRAALLHGIEGRVVIEFSVGTDGGAQNMRVVSALPAGVFDQSALRAMRGWKYTAASAGRFRQTMAFTLIDGSANRASAYGANKAAIAAQISCQVPTGTHICRLPENEQ